MLEILDGVQCVYIPTRLKPSFLSLGIMAYIAEKNDKRNSRRDVFPLTGSRSALFIKSILVLLSNAHFILLIVKLVYTPAIT